MAKKQKTKKPANKTKRLVIASVIFLALALIYTQVDIILFLICFAIALVLGFLAYRRIKADKEEKARRKAEYEQGQQRAREKEEQRKANRELMKNGIYPAFKNADYDFSNIVVVDTETTGKNAGKDEMLQLSVTDAYGNELFDHYLKPKHKRTWTEAEEVNGISPDMVKGEKHIDAYEDEVTALLYGKTIVGYNIDFDAGFLKEAGLIGNKAVLVDVMLPFAEINGEYNYRYDEYKWKKLTDCARYYNYKWEAKAHNSLADCKATAFCFRKMCGRD